MPQKALVAFGVAVVTVLLVLPAPAWCSDVKPSGQTISRSIDATPKTEEVNTHESPATLPVLTLDDVFTRVLKQSPELSAVGQEVKAREFEALQEGLLPNPEFSVEVENLAGSGKFSGTDSAETTVRISQLFELGGKRKQRKEIGRMDTEVAERESEIARAEVLFEASQRFIAVLAAQKRLTLAGEQVDLTRRVFQTVEERIEAGKTPALEKVRVQTLVADARLRQEKARQELTAARQVLASSWGSAQVDFAGVQGSFEKVPGVPPLPELTTRLNQSPDVALFQSEARRADRSVALERAGRIPDLTLSVGAKNDRDSGDNALVAEVSIPLPVFDRNQGAVAAARARKAKAEEEANLVQTRLLASLAEGRRKLQAAHSEVTVLREEILPATRKTFDAVVYGYRAGKFGFLDVLDAERSLFEAKSRYVEALVSYHQSVSELERLLGQKVLLDATFPAPDNKERGQS